MAETAVTQPAPQEFFRPGLVLAELACAWNVRHEHECKMPGREMKFVFWLALILTFSPGEKEQPLCVSGSADTCPTNPVARISVRRRTILPLLGERTG